MPSSSLRPRRPTSVPTLPSPPSLCHRRLVASDGRCRLRCRGRRSRRCRGSGSRCSAIQACSAAYTGCCACQVRPASLEAQPQQQQQQEPRQKEAWCPVSVPNAHHGLRPHPAYPAHSARSAFRSPANPTSVGPRASQQLPSRNQAPLLPRPAPSVSSGYQSSQAPRQTGATSHELATLQAQILDLKSKLTTREGEISIVRKRLEKTREDHKRELQIVKAQTAEQLAKQERAVEAARAAQQSATTELEFTRRDLREEVVRAKRQDGPGTPKKNAVTKTWGVSDGFEDVEMAGSPSKGKRGKNVGPVAGSVVEPPAKLLRTPTKSKRKRPAVDSPVTALETHSEDVVMLDDVGVPVHDIVGISPMAPVTQCSVPFDVGSGQRLLLNDTTLMIILVLESYPKP